MLALLDSSLEENSDAHWLFDLLCKHRKSFHPIRHLLLIRFLTGSVDRFFTTKYQYQPFGKAPWICLNPDVTKTELRRLSPATYTWLYRHDRDWLKGNSPVLQQPIATNERVDWVKRDLEVLVGEASRNENRVKLAIAAMLNVEKPQRLTISGIGKAIGLLALLEQHLDLMPMTGDYLGTVAESIEDFQIRRIRWAMGELDRRKEPMVSWRVMRLAGLGGNISDRVREVLDAV